jgi:hypothetical protein
MADAKLLASDQAAPLRHTDHPVMAQVGWLGDRDGSVYDLSDPPYDREPGGFSPLYIQIGAWVLVDGKWTIHE